MGHSVSMLNPSGGIDDRRGLTQPALHDDLMVRIVDRANLQRAWKRVRANQGAPGVDGMTLEDFPDFARMHWSDIRQALLDGTYQPQPVRRVAIPKPSGGERRLGIPTVVDRVLQQAIGQVLTPLFDPGFSESSYGFRPGRCAHGALRQIQRYIGEGYRVAVDLDLEKFFDKVNHDVLMARVAAKVRDKTLLALIGRYLRSGVLVGQDIQATQMGTPQGGPLSPDLATVSLGAKRVTRRVPAGAAPGMAQNSILLDDLDKELERRGHRFARYADDLLVLVRSERAGQRVNASITRFLTTKLKLVVNEHKSRVVKTNACEFLGFTFRGMKLRWTDRAFDDFKHRVRKLTGRSWGVSMAYRLDQLGRYVRGWMTNRQEC